MKWRPIAVCFLTVGISGCGSKLSSLKGTVFVDDKPAPAGISLAFAPTEAGGSPSYANTDEAGRYQAAFTFRETGIQPGKYRVHLMPGSGGDSNRMPEIGPDGKPVSSVRSGPLKFPKEYYQEITTITVGSGSNTIDLKLTTTSNENNAAK